MEANGLPSRTAILTAAARAVGSREPYASVRNPDSVADRLIGPAELALIADHPLSTRPWSILIPFLPACGQAIKSGL